MVASQVFTLVGVALGALASFLATALSERARHRREIAKGWEERKYDCYAGYVHEVKTLSVVARRMAAALGLTERSTDKLDPEAGSSLLTEAEVRRSVSAEKLRLLSDAETIVAASKLNEAVWRLEWIAREKIPDATPEQWREADKAFARAFDDFHRCARRELGVPGHPVLRQFVPLPNEEQTHGGA